MKKKIALFTNINKNYFFKAVRCFEIFEEQNPGVFDFFIVTSDTEAKSLPNVNVIILNPKDYIEGYSDTGYPPESFLYFAVPDILRKYGYDYSMHIDADVVCLKELDFSWVDEDFVFAGAPRMRNNLSEQIDCWYYLKAVCDNDTIQFLESTFELQNKDNIIDIQDGVMVINNERWFSEQIYKKSYDLFTKCKDAGYPMKDTDILLGLLILDTPKSFYKHLTPSWNWYYEIENVESMGGDDANILHMAWVKPWEKNKKTKNRNIQKGLSIWNKTTKRNMRLHIIGNARNPSTNKLPMDPYSMISYYVTTYLHDKGHEVHYYGYEESSVSCTKKWVCGNSDFLEKYFVTEYKDKQWTDSHEANSIFFNKAGNYLLDNYNESDIIICMWSPAVDILRTLLPNAKIVDGNINHRLPSKATNYHVYSSVANQHFNYGIHNIENYWQDVVIAPMANELSNFTYNENKKDYFFFMARLGINKGITLFKDLANQFPDKKFIIAGQGDINIISLSPNMEFVGCLGVEERKKYLSEAKAVISPSYYAEPFGLTPIEAGLSGTPVICTDWGGYTDNVLHNITGFRCSYFNDFVKAINNIDKINPRECREWAEQFTAESLIDEWEDYLQKINRPSWYSLD
jgi:glycosyltransferase involved in cell wall biosynthesis